MAHLVTMLSFLAHLVLYCLCMGNYLWSSSCERLAACHIS